MKGYLKIFLGFPKRRCRWILALAIAFLWPALKGQAQIYIDNAWQHSVFIHEGDFHFHPTQNQYVLTFGIIVYEKKDGIFHTGLDFSGFARTLNREWYERNYRYTFRGLALKIFAGVEPVNNLKLEAGIALAAYGQRLEVDGDKQSMGPGFQNGDWGPMVRTEYYIHPNFALGFSATRWCVSMLRYREIGNFGEFLPEKRWIETIDYSVFLRVQFFNSLKR